MSTPSPQIDFGSRSDRGRVRPKNEDHFLIVRRQRSRTVIATNLDAASLTPSSEDAHVFCVADGMGGKAFGDLASHLALRTGWELGGADSEWFFRLTDADLTALREQAKLYIEQIDRALLAHARAQPEASGMGTTLTTVYSAGMTAVVFHVGDSRAYLYRGGALSRLTRDHTMAQALADSGAIAPAAVGASPFRSILTSYLGGGLKDLRVDSLQVPLAADDGILLCTDGLTDMVPEPEIVGTLAAHAGAQGACDALVAKALDNGGRDNVTVVVARYRSPA